MLLIVECCKVTDDVICEVDTKLLLVCPDHDKKEGHRLIPVLPTNQETCLAMWSDSELLEFGNLLRCSPEEAIIPGIYVLEKAVL